jgi:tetratricopeptide (TPR) repeat protein
MLAALAHMKLGHQSQALELFRQTEREVPPDSDLALDAAYNRLLCFYQIEGEHVGDQADAFLQLYAKGRPKDPKIHTARLMKAETLAARKQFREAAETYNSIDPALISEANRPGFLFQRGWCLAVAGDNQGAVRSFSKFIADFPKDPRVPQALAKRGETALADGDRATALRDFDQLIHDNASHELAAFAWQQSARLKKDEGDLDGMIQRYSALLENFPKLDSEAVANANYWIGWGHAKNDRPREAIPFLRKARELDAKTYGRPATLQLVVSFFALQDPGELATELDVAIRDQYASQVPESALRWAGTQMYNGGRFAEAATNHAKPQRSSGATSASHASKPAISPKPWWRWSTSSKWSKTPTGRPTPCSTKPAVC